MATCTRCNRPLKDPRSIQRGYGPVCWARVQGQEESEKDRHLDEYLDEPLDEYIVLERDGVTIRTNVPHLVTHHSPTGYEWGYAGSGPADLALNIIENVLRNMGFKGETTNGAWDKRKTFFLSWAIYQPFKFEFLAGMPQEGGRIYVNDVIAWIKRQPTQEVLL